MIKRFLGAVTLAVFAQLIAVVMGM